MVLPLILVSSYLGFLLLRSRVSVLSRLALDSVHLLDGLLEAGDDDEAANHGALAGLTAIAPDDEALMPPASHDAPDPLCDVRPDPR